MTDLEMTKLCAEAMGYTIAGSVDKAGAFCTADEGSSHILFNPLHDDAQAMALVKKFKLQPHYTGAGNEGLWTLPRHGVAITGSPNLNRAIVECVAKMQAAK